MARRRTSMGGPPACCEPRHHGFQHAHVLRNYDEEAGKPRRVSRWIAPGRATGGMTATRRLATILAADVVGYSRLMGIDEEGTLKLLKAHRRELIDPKIAEHHGRIVKTTGDGILIEFASVVDAVRCAVEVQQRMGERNADVPGDHRIEFRVGIKLGDIII